MIAETGRARLLVVTRQITDARGGRNLLDQKRGALVRALAERAPRLEETRAAAIRAVAKARAALVEAQLDLGRTAIDAAALAQSRFPGPTLRPASVAGVPVVDIDVPDFDFQPRYGPASGSPSLDAAGAAFVSSVPVILKLAAEEASERNLQKALQRVIRRMNALDTVIIPQLLHEQRRVADGLEEDERDEAVRRHAWLTRARSSAGGL